MSWFGDVVDAVVDTIDRAIEEVRDWWNDDEDAPAPENGAAPGGGLDAEQPAPDAGVPGGAPVQPCPANVIHTFVWDPPHTTDRRQYVNLPDSWDRLRNGRNPILVGHVEPREAGVLVLFNLIHNPANDADAGVSYAIPIGISGANGIVEVSLGLTVFGGSRFKVGGRTSDMAAPVESGELTVWRKVFYQITEMANSPAPENLSLAAPAGTIAALQAAFDPVFFEIEAGATSSATTPYKAHLTQEERSALEATLRPGAVDARSPYKMNIVMVDAADIVAEQTHSDASASAVVTTPEFRRWPHQDTVIEAVYQSAATPAPGGTWSPLVNVASTDSPTTPGNAFISATIPGFTAPGPVNVRIRYRTLRGRAGGWGGTTGTLFMCLGFDRRADPARPTGADLQQALTHEIGHALGLVPNDAIWRDMDARDLPYSLKHCGYGGAAAPRCVMWFMLGGSGARLRFCGSDRPSDCSHFLKKTDYQPLRWI